MYIYNRRKQHRDHFNSCCALAVLALCTTSKRRSNAAAMRRLRSANSASATAAYAGLQCGELEMRRAAEGSKPFEFERHGELDDGRTLRGGWMHDPFVHEQRKHRAKVNEPDAVEKHFAAACVPPVTGSGLDRRGAAGQVRQRDARHVSVTAASGAGKRARALQNRPLSEGTEPHA